jgi:hypothetical protein
MVVLLLLSRENPEFLVVAVAGVMNILVALELVDILLLAMQHVVVVVVVVAEEEDILGAVADTIDFAEEEEDIQYAAMFVVKPVEGHVVAQDLDSVKNYLFVVTIEQIVPHLQYQPLAIDH